MGGCTFSDPVWPTMSPGIGEEPVLALDGSAVGQEVTCPQADSVRGTGLRIQLRLES